MYQILIHSSLYEVNAVSFHIEHLFLHVNLLLFFLVVKTAIEEQFDLGSLAKEKGPSKIFRLD